MIKLGLGLLGLLASAAPIGYVVYKNWGNNKDMIENSNLIDSLPDKDIHIELSEDKSSETVDSIPAKEERELLEKKKKISDWISKIGGCKVKIYDEKSSEYLEISELPDSFEFDEFLKEMQETPNRWKGFCEQSNSSIGRSGNLEGVVEEMMLKKQDNGKWDISVEDDDFLEES